MPQLRKANLRVDATQTKDLGDGIVEVIVATNRLDRHGERLDIKGLNTKDYSGVVMLNHDYNALPIGKSLKLTKTNDGKLVSKAQFAIEEYPIAKTVYDLIKGGYITDASIGFIPKEWDEENSTWTKSEMVEYSIVGIGANADAKITKKALADVGITQKQFEQQIVDHIAQVKELTKDTEDEEVVTDEPQDIKTKGGVANVLMQESKYDQMEDFWEVVYAFCDAFYSTAASPADFGTLLQECISILQTIIDGNYAFEDEEDENDSPMIMSLRKPDAAKVKALAAVFEPASTEELDNLAGAEDNVREHITAIKSLLSALESDLSAQPKPTEVATKAQNIKKRIVLVRAKRTLQTVDRIAELAIGEIKRNTK